MTDQTDWVSLGEAANLLGVHPSTVRQWADSGDLPSQRTPGGHRRFRKSDLEQWQDHSNSETSPSEIQILIQNALGRARLEVGGGQLEGLEWYDQMDQEARRQHGMMGRQILNILTRYIVNPESHSAIVDEIHQLGAEYAKVTQEQNLSLTEAVQAFLFFRDLLVDSIIQMADVLRLSTPTEWGTRVKQVNHLTDELLLAMIRYYESLQS